MYIGQILSTDDFHRVLVYPLFAPGLGKWAERGRGPNEPTHGWDSIKDCHLYSFLFLSIHKNVKCYPTMTKIHPSSQNPKASQIERPRRLQPSQGALLLAAAAIAPKDVPARGWRPLQGFVLDPRSPNSIVVLMGPGALLGLLQLLCSGCIGLVARVVGVDHVAAACLGSLN